MGLIQDMAKKGDRAAAKLPVPTTAGDDQMIAAKTGEYVLPPEVVQAIGVDKLNALVESITGRKPGGQPAEMPEGAMHEMMEGETEGYAKGGCVKDMKGYARGGLISQIEKGLSNAMTVGASLMPDRYAAPIAPPDLSNVTPDVFRVEMPTMQPAPQRKRRSLADLGGLEDMGVFGEESNIMGYNRGGLISRMKGYADGGLVEDELRRRLAQVAAEPAPAQPGTQGRPALVEAPGTRARLDGYNPQSTIRQPEPQFPRANELRGYNPQATIRQPAPAAPAPDVNSLRSYNPQSTIPPNATTNASPRAPELRTFTPEAGRLQPGSTTPRISGLAATPPAGTPSATVRALDARVPGATSGGSLAGRVAGAALVPVGEAAGQFVVGVDADVRNRFYNDPNVGWTEKAKQFGRDAAGIALPSVGAAVGAGAGSVVAPVAGTVAGGAAGYGIGSGIDAGLQAALGESALDRYKATQPQQVAQAPQMDPKAQSDEIARRRAALEPQPSFEQKIGKFIADERATPTPAAATARGPISGLAARAQRPAAKPAAAPQVDTAGLQAQIDASPIASVQSGPVGQDGQNGHLVTYKDGSSQFVQQLPEDAKAWYALTARANSNAPVEVIKGTERFVASPESGYQAVPKFVADAGMTGQYVNAAGQGWVDAVAPQEAELRTGRALIDARTNASIKQHNATGDLEGRGLRNDLARMELDLTKKALAGDQQAIQQLNLLRGNRGAQDEYAATSREVPIKPGDSLSGMIKEPVIYNKRTGQIMQPGTVQSSSTAPAGMKQIGTSGGKPVYQDAQGKRFIGD